MSDHNNHAGGAAIDNSYGGIGPETGFGDLFRFLYRRRVKLAIYFLAVFFVGFLCLLAWSLFSTKTVEGTLGLSFRGIERGQYPNGKRFSVEDFRSPDGLAQALGDAGIPEKAFSIKELGAAIFITPVIPGEIQSRWRRQDKDGIAKEAYFPNEFKIGITLKGLSNQERLRFFDALVKCYQQRVKYDQTLALSLIPSPDRSYEKLVSNYDLWDIPEIFRSSYTFLSARLRSLAAEAALYYNPRFQLSFRALTDDLDTWNRTRLQTLEAMTYQGQLVRNRDMIVQRIQYRLQDLDIRIRQRSKETEEAIRLIEVIDRPKALLAGQLSTKEGTQLFDATALDKLLKSDYLGPIVERISGLQEEVQTMQADRDRLEKQLAQLPRAPSVVQVPAGYKELMGTLSAELNALTSSYNKILDEYLTALISDQVAIRQAPVIVALDYSYVSLLGVLLLVSLLIALVALGVERLVENANPHYS